MSKQLNSGVYCIYNKQTYKFYIGSSVDLRERLNWHRRRLLSNKHNAKYLQKSFNKRGLQAFVFKVLRYCKPEECIFLEQYFLNAIDPEYNTLKIAGSPLGFKHTEESKKLMSIVQTGKKMSEESKKKNSLLHKGKPLSLEHRKKMSIAHKGKILSDETKLKMSAFQKIRDRSKWLKAVKKICPNSGIVLSEYKSVKEAAEINNINSKYISAVLKNKRKKTGGFIWQYC